MSAASAYPRFVQRTALSGFGACFALTLFWLSLIIVLPLAALVLRPWELGLEGVWRSLAQPRVLAALRLSFGLALLAAAIDVVLGLLIAWTLTRIRFPGRRLANTLVDVPLALPTAVAGIALTALYAPQGWLGAPLGRIGIKVAYGWPGILVALVFVGLPFVVRTLQPVLAELRIELEEAAATLGATRLQILRRIILPVIAPPLVGGFSIAFARAVGEYGSVIFIAGNLPMISEIAPLLIVIRLEQFDYAGAAAVAVVMLAASFLILLALSLVQRRLRPWAA